MGSVYYWMGDIFLAKASPDQAAQYFKYSSNAHHNPKAPDAMVKLGTIYAANGDSAHAKQLFEKVIKLYPNSQASKSAAEKLASLTSFTASS